LFSGATLIQRAIKFGYLRWKSVAFIAAGLALNFNYAPSAKWPRMKEQFAYIIALSSI